MILLLFEPFSCALLAGAVEYVCSRPERAVPRIRVWLRRNSESLVDAMVQEAVEPLLDITNSVVDVRLMTVSAALLVLLRAVCVLFTMWSKRWSDGREH